MTEPRPPWDQPYTELVAKAYAEREAKMQRLFELLEKWPGLQERVRLLEARVEELEK